MLEKFKKEHKNFVLAFWFSWLVYFVFIIFLIFAWDERLEVYFTRAVFIIAFTLAVVTFVIAYLIIWFLTLIYSLFNKKLGKNHIYAFYLTIIVLLANNIIPYYLFELRFMLAIGTTPLFVTMLLTWLSIKAFQYLRNLRQSYRPKP
jgi:hypothetical protein